MSSTTTRHNGRNGHGSRFRDTETAEQIARLFGALPPHDHEAECALLGSMLLDPRVIGEVLQVIKSPEDFFKPKHAALYQVIVECYDKHPDLDLVQIRSELQARGMLEQIGGVEYLIELAESVPNAGYWRMYGKTVNDRARKRDLIHAGAGIVQSAHGSDDAADLIDRAESEVFRIGEQAAQMRTDTSFGALLQDTYDALERADGLARGLETGFYELDAMTNGFQPGDLVILAARPSMGKTSLAMNFAEHIAVTLKQPCAFFSMEMSRDQLARRLMCSRANVDSHRVRRNTLDSDEFGRLAMAVGDMAEAPLHIDDTPGLSLMQLRAKARRLAARHGIRALFIDYLQLMTCPGAENRLQEVSELSRGIKQLARELDVPVLCLSQLNRAVETRANNRPKMSDLRESGSIEQDADTVMLLHREDYYHKADPAYAKTHDAELIIDKQRNGPTGAMKLVWDAACTKFKNMAHGGTW